MKKLAEAGLENVRIFLRAAEKGSMTEAAKTLFITQPAVSHAIALLEDRLECRLFARKGKRLTLTPAGWIVYEAADRMAEALRAGDRKLERLRGIEESTLTIGAPFLFLHGILAPFLSRFHRDHPGVRIRIEIENRMAEMQAIAKSGRADLFFFGTPKAEDVDPALEAVALARFRYCFMASPEHYPELVGRKLSLRDLNELPIAILRPGNSTRSFMEARFAEDGLALNVHYEAATMAVVEDFARMGLGIAAMLRFPGFDKEGLFELKLDRKFEPGVFLAVSRRGEHLSAAAEAFLDLVRQELQKA